MLQTEYLQKNRMVQMSKKMALAGWLLMAAAILGGALEVSFSPVEARAATNIN